METPDLRIRAAEAIEESVAWHTVGIIANRAQGIGTGSAVLWRNHRLILTARHVVLGTPDQDLRFFFRADGTLMRQAADQPLMHPGPEMNVRKFIQIEQRLDFLAEDLTILRVPMDIEEDFNVRFFDLEDCSFAPPDGATVVFMGYPADTAVDVGEGDLAVFPSVEWSRVGSKNVPHDLDPKIAFAVEYCSGKLGRRPHGFSGAGVWFHQSVGEVWHPNLKFAGICTHYSRPERLLHVLRVEVICNCLRRDLS